MPRTNDREATRRKLGWRPEDFIALHAGNMGVKQGLEGLIDVARLAEGRGSSVRIVLMGDGSRRGALEAYGAGLQQLTICDGLPKGQFEAALSAADCLLLHEKAGVVEMSVPSKLTTYFTAGRPVVAATDTRSGASSMMTSAGAGISVSAGAPDRILEAIEMLATDPQAAITFGENGRRFAAAHLSGVASLTRKEAWLHSLMNQ